jgi:hypothetical protein
VACNEVIQPAFGVALLAGESQVGAGAAGEFLTEGKIVEVIADGLVEGREQA